MEKGIEKEKNVIFRDMGDNRSSYDSVDLKKKENRNKSDE